MNDSHPIMGTLLTVTDIKWMHSNNDTKNFNPLLTKSKCIVDKKQRLIFFDFVDTEIGNHDFL